MARGRATNRPWARRINSVRAGRAPAPGRSGRAGAPPGWTIVPDRISTGARLAGRFGAVPLDLEALPCGERLDLGHGLRDLDAAELPPVVRLLDDMAEPHLPGPIDDQVPHGRSLRFPGSVPSFHHARAPLVKEGRIVHFSQDVARIAGFSRVVASRKSSGPRCPSLPASGPASSRGARLRRCDTLHRAGRGRSTT